MTDEITINLRALTLDAIEKIELIIDSCLNDIPDETNEEALEVLQNFNE